MTPSPTLNRSLAGAQRASLGRRDRRKLETRQALLDATHSLLASRNLDTLSVDEIATRADVAKGTFYNYFADKEALARELAARVRLRMEDEIARANAGVEDPVTRVARALCCVLRFGLREPHQAAAMMRLFPHATDPSAPLNAGVRGDIAAGLSRRRIVAPSQDTAVAAIVGGIMAGLNRVMDLTPDRALAFAKDLGTILLRALGLDRSEAARIMKAAVETILG
ncbi:MAG TPA: helix-turn-helix domain-containing protein [Candidatus Binataceae bacterium]|nr:helix-turn-helix domain-containing protein [Candidatus Binataceae bacterium]